MADPDTDIDNTVVAKTTPGDKVSFSERFPLQPTPSVSTGIDDLTRKEHRIESVIESLKKPTEEYSKALTSEEARIEQADREFQARANRQLRAEAVGPDDFKKWNAEAEAAKRQTNPWEAFGSPAFLIAMLGSAFSAMPMNTALQAGGAAINAINQGNMDDYNRAFDAWKQNTELVFKRHRVEHENFEDILAKHRGDLEGRRLALLEHTYKFENERMRIMLENGMEPEVYKAQDAMAKSVADAKEAYWQNLHTNTKIQLFNNDPRAKSGNPELISQALFDAEAKSNAAQAGLVQFDTKGNVVRKDGKVLPYEQAFGWNAALFWMKRKANDLFYGELSEETASQTQAEEEISLLQNRVTSALSRDVTGSRLKFIQQKVQELFPAVGHVLTGPGEAKNKLTGLREYMMQTINENKSIILDPQTKPQDKEKARMRIYDQMGALKEVEKILSVLSIPPGYKARIDETGKVWVQPKGNE